MMQASAQRGLRGRPADSASLPLPGLPANALRPSAVTAAGLGAGLVLAGLIAFAGPYPAMLAVCVLALIAAVAVRPALAAYLLIAATPLVAGINRGGALPAIRPNEALLVIAGAGLLIHAVANGRTGRPRLTSVDGALLLLAVTSSFVPLAWMAIRGATIERDDLLYSLMLWKYYAVFLAFRFAVRSLREVRMCLWLSMLSAAAVSVLAVLQVLGVGPVVNVLAADYAPYGAVDAVTSLRGGSTLGLPIAVADLMLINLGIAAGLLAFEPRGQRLRLLALAFVFVLGVFAAAEFSGVIGLAIAVIVIAVATRRISYLAAALIPVVVGALVLRSVIEARLQGFQSPSGLPISWEGRLHNLEGYFWPRLFSGDSWLLGVRPAARVVTQKIATGYIWIESGYTWLLWAGGVPLLLSFVYFLYVAYREGGAMLRCKRAALQAAGLGLVTALSFVAVLMIVDPHITYRGSGDLIFALLGITAAGRTILRGEPGR
jgi:hypothetical protein